MYAITFACLHALWLRRVSMLPSRSQRGLWSRCLVPIPGPNPQVPVPGYSYEYDLNTLLDSHFLQEGEPRNLSEIKFLANPRSLLDIIE